MTEAICRRYDMDIEPNLKTDSCFIETQNDDAEIEFLSNLKKKVRENILIGLKEQGFFLTEENSIEEKALNKEEIRKLHKVAVNSILIKNEKFVTKNEKRLIQYFANGKEVNPDDLSVRLEIVKTGELSGDLFRYASLLWSVPISSGYGRRIRFLVWDNSNGKLIGIFALGDPVFNLRCRDSVIGWNSENRKKRIYNVMDAFILGSVPPYNAMLGGKLVAMVVASNEVRNEVKSKYSNKKGKDSTLALITTSSALGKSTIYDRIRYNGEILYKSVGYSEGYGHFHISNEIFQDIVEILKKEGKMESNRFGNGPNWKFRVIRKGLSAVGLSPDILKHGIKREVYCVPLADNYKEYLCEKTDLLSLMNAPIEDVVTEWKERWMKNRIITRTEYKTVTREETAKLVRRDVIGKK